MSEAEEPIDIEALLARMAPPTTPAGAVEIDPLLERSIRKFDRLQLTTAFSGLQTVAAFQANSIRFEWAARLALALGTGDQRPGRKDLERILNRRLRHARVTRLEDPIEDVMVEPIQTPRGEFLIFTGTWEKAGYFTETVLRAFALLPEGSPKADALTKAYALLALSDALVRRSRVPRYAVGAGQPNGDLNLPPSKELEALRRRVVFSWADLDEAGFAPDLLAPFILDPRELGSLLGQEPGDSRLEFQPLVLAEEGLIVAAPTNLSTAIRAYLIDAAIVGGMDGGLRHRLLAIQGNLIEEGGLLRLRGPIAPFAEGFGREHVEEISLGRYLHVVHAIGDFSGWPAKPFAVGEPASSDFAEAITKSVSSACSFAAKQEGFTSGLSFIFLSGWGSGRSLSLEWPELRGWRVIFLEPQDGFVLGGCEDGSVKDLWWMHLQFHHVQEMGFEFQQVNGFLNLFQWWRNTDHAFVPPHMIDVEPPIWINFDTDLLLEARREALLAWDRRSFPTIKGNHVTVMRMNPQTLFENLEPIYASYAAARAGRVIAALLIEDRFPIWFDLDHHPSEPTFSESHETFKALLSWSVRVLPPLVSDKIGPNERPIGILLNVQWPEDGPRPMPPLSDEEVERAVSVDIDETTRQIRVVLAPDWQRGLQRPDNIAEAALAATVLAGILRLLGTTPLENGTAVVRSVIGSDDARWRHSFEVDRVIEALRAHNLVDRFTPISTSVAALVKTGLGWATHPRKEGAIIRGKQECRKFLDDQVMVLLTSLRAALRQFRRDAIIKAALSAIHSAQAEERQWERSARALRAIHGRDSDFSVSLNRRAQVNSVLRSASILAELGQTECPLSDGRDVGPMDMSELEAHALLLFQTADLIPAIVGGRVEPEFKISPTGDVLSDHGFAENTVQRSAKVTHRAQRDRASRDYMRRDDSSNTDAFDVAQDLSEAMKIEYGVALDTFVGLGEACMELAVETGDGEGILRIPRSTLVRYIGGKAQSEDDIEALIDRLTLRPRDDWDHAPSGTSARDFDLAKLDRRYSLIGRPLLALDDSDDPDLIVAPGVIERCILHNLQGAIQGTLQNEFWSSDTMRRFVGERGRQEGMRFNESVAKSLRALGLTAYASAKPSWCFNHKNTPEVAALGDFDVLAITADAKRAWIVEAKDLKLCRTIGETARRLSEYEGKLLSSGKPDKMMRHLRRVAYARTHASDLQKRLGLARTPEVSGIMVVRAPQPMEAVSLKDEDDARVVMLADIGEVPWDQGWPN